MRQRENAGRRETMVIEPRSPEGRGRDNRKQPGVCERGDDSDGHAFAIRDIDQSWGSDYSVDISSRLHHVHTPQGSCEERAVFAPEQKGAANVSAETVGSPVDAWQGSRHRRSSATVVIKGCDGMANVLPR